MSQVLRECVIVMLTAGMSTRAVAKELNVHFSTKSRLKCCFREFGSTSNWPNNRRLHVTTPSPEPPHPASSPAGSSETSHPGSWGNCGFAQPKNFSGKLICVLVVLTRVLALLQFSVVNDFSGQMLTFNGHSVHSVNRVPHGGGGVMVWAGISYGQRTQLHFIDGNFNAQIYREEILRPILCRSSTAIMFQHNALPHFARIWTQFLESENGLVLPWPAYSPDMSHIEHVWGGWINMYNSVFQFPQISSNFAQRRGTTFHRQQSTA
jgi:hypothetical protein